MVLRFTTRHNSALSQHLRVADFGSSIKGSSKEIHRSVTAVFVFSGFVEALSERAPSVFVEQHLFTNIRMNRDPVLRETRIQQKISQVFLGVSGSICRKTNSSETMSQVSSKFVPLLEMRLAQLLPSTFHSLKTDRDGRAPARESAAAGAPRICAHLP